MVRENICFLSCAVSLENRPQQFYRSPFAISNEDRELLRDESVKDDLVAAISAYNVPVFIIENAPERSKVQVDNFVRNDAYILRVALMIYSIRVKILAGTRAESFYWLASNETLRLIERMDDMQTIDALIKGELFVRPVRPLTELLSGEWGSLFGEDKRHMAFPAYLQVRYENWSHGQ